MGGCQNCGPFIMVPEYSTAPSIEGIQKGTIILTTTHIHRTVCFAPFSLPSNVGFFWKYITRHGSANEAQLEE